MMTMMRNIFLAAMGLVFFISCKNDDDNTVEVEVRDRGEVQVESSANLTAYLDTHFYIAGSLRHIIFFTFFY